MREYFSLLLRALVSPSSPVRLFEGREHSLLPMHNTDALTILAKSPWDTRKKHAQNWTFVKTALR